MEYDFDLFVIGAGSGGVRASRMSASYGARVGIAEDMFLGGTCVNVGCVPKKLFVYGSHYSEEFSNAASYGWSVGDAPFDWSTMRDNKNREIERLNAIYGGLLSDAGVTLFNDRARLLDAHTIAVGEEEVTSKNILIATGSWPVVPDVKGKEHIITSNEAFYLEDFPKKVTVVGGGYIAVEFAGIFNGFGAETTLVYRGDMFLRGFDKSLREFVKQELEKSGIDLKFNTQVKEIRSTDDKDTNSRYQISLEDGGMLNADLVMYATGRKPKTDNLGLENLGIEQGANGKIVVNEFYQTSVENIFAIGDVTDRMQLTPVAIEEGMCIANNLFTDNPKKTLNYANIPTAVFCQPNLGTVGLREDEACELYPDDLDIFESEFRPMKHTLTGKEERTLMKLIVQRSSDLVLGVHMVGPDAGELIQGMAVALIAGATKSQFDATVGIHPTAAEEFVTMRSISRTA